MGTIFNFLLKGIPLTFLVAIGAWALSALVAVPVVAASRSRFRVLRAVADAFTMSMRGVPELVALFVVYFGLQGTIPMSPVTAAILTFGVVESPFVSEIYRAALTTVRAGQRDAAESIGLDRMRVFTDVIVPQAVRFAIPPMLNMLIGMLNLSSVASAIDVHDIIFRGQLIFNSSSTGSTFLNAAVGICLVYLVMVIPLSIICGIAEWALRVERRPFRIRAPWRLSPA
ncbi:MAG TPA: ABC transporter permease subunit [Solirubrobacteraceae bacterium]|nr:ABC transporter permease subunit [Solirubrobacteraceae bacterium]